jgi:cell shape-determining protein MreC
LGDRVYGPGNVLVGRVSEATDSTAKVVMYSSVGEKNDMIVERTSESISVEGSGGGNLEAEVPQEMDIVVGDALVLPQFNGAVVASVVSIDASVTSAFKRVLFKTPLNVFSFRWVNVTQ